jgi:hypothetical protein
VKGSNIVRCALRNYGRGAAGGYFPRQRLRIPDGTPKHPAELIDSSPKLLVKEVARAGIITHGK